MDRSTICATLLSMVAHKGTLAVATAHASLKDQGASDTTRKRAVADLLAQGTLVRDGDSYKVVGGPPSSTTTPSPSTAPVVEPPAPAKADKPKPEPVVDAKTTDKPTTDTKLPPGTVLDGADLKDAKTGEVLDTETGEPKEKAVKKSKKADKSTTDKVTKISIPGKGSKKPKADKTTKAPKAKKEPSFKIVKITAEEAETKREHEAVAGGPPIKEVTVKAGGKDFTVRSDGRRTSGEGCLAWFRELLEETGEGESCGTRDELLDYAITTFGPKAKFATQNYISLAKKGLLQDCNRIEEDKDGNMVVGAFVAKKERKAKGGKGKAKADKATKESK